MTARATRPAFGPGGFTRLEEHIPVSTEIGDEIGATSAGQAIVDDEAEEGFRFHHLIFDIPLGFGVALNM
jgi:hypothetical protein